MHFLGFKVNNVFCKCHEAKCFQYNILLKTLSLGCLSVDTAITGGKIMEIKSIFCLKN